MPDRYNKTYPISWEQLHRDAKALAWRLVDLQQWKGIVAITRGGLVPAAVIARELDIHLVDTICISSYNWQDQGSVNILKAAQGDGKGWLLIDVRSSGLPRFQARLSLSPKMWQLEQEVSPLPEVATAS